MTLKGCGCNVSSEEGPHPPNKDSLPETILLVGEYGPDDIYCLEKAAMAPAVNKA